jgi:hypothetical protein
VKQPELTSYRLRFPSEITERSVLAALSSFSGVPHGTRLTFDLVADVAGIAHFLSISRPTAGVVTGGLRAALPSLRLDPVVALPRHSGVRLLWQLGSPLAVIRSDDLGGIAAALLASLFPLGARESVQLSWHVRPSGRPSLTTLPEHHQDGQTAARKQKLALPGISGYGELSVEAASATHRKQLIRRVGSVLHSLNTPYGHLCADPVRLGQLLRLVALRGHYLSVRELAAVIGWPIDAPDLPGLELGAAKRLVASRALPVSGRVLGTSDFAGAKQTVAITPTASTKGLYVLGPTGTGKTSLLKNLIRDDLEQGRGVAVVETNGDLITDVVDLIPPHRIPDVVLIDPTDRLQAVGFNPFAGGVDPSLTADQLGELFQRLWKAFWGPRTGQLAHMGLLTLAQRSGSTLVDLPRLFLDAAFRGSVLATLNDPVGLEQDWRWFLKLNDREQATVIAPLLNKVRQFTARPSIRAIVGQPEPAISMRDIMAGRKVLLVNLPKGLIGAETATLLGCLVLTSLWQAAAERAGLAREERHPFGLYVDEVQDFASAPIPWDEMFAQGRKYGLSLSVAHQNLGQLPRDLREVVLANARSKVVFALSAPDARSLEPLFAPALQASDLRALDAHSIAALVALDDGSTGRPVTLSTPAPPTPCGSSARVRAASHAAFARPVAEVEAALRAAAGGHHRPSAPVGRQRRRR